MGRREFSKRLGIASLALAMPGCIKPNSPTVLILGGTNFLGPAVVNAYLKAGYQVTLFNRGVTNSHLFPNLTKLVGDRDQGLTGYQALVGSDHQWDVVVDVWPQQPHFVKDAIEILKEKTSHYQFVSSIAVYNSFGKPGINEESPLLEAEEYEEGNYSENKVLCERLVAQHFPNSHTIVRPGGIVGARDPGPFSTDLIRRFSQRSELLMVDAADPVQFIDADDIGTFLTTQASKTQAGVFNLVGPATTLGYKDLIQAIKAEVNPQIKIHWVDSDWALKQEHLTPFMGVPFWIPLKDDPEPGFYQIDQNAALQAGLQFKPLQKTIADAYQSWTKKEYIPEAESEATFGISDQQEDQLIQAWLSYSDKA